MHKTLAAKSSALLFAAALLTAIGCAGNKPAPAAPAAAASTAPDWVNKGNGAFKDSAGASVFYGVGVSEGIRQYPLARSTADDRGRAEIAQTMNTFVTVLSKSYLASTSAGDPGKSSEEQHVSNTLKNFAKFTLHGARVIDHYEDNKGRMFSLVQLDLAAVKKSLEESKELDSKVRDYVKANAEKAFDELSSEDAKH